MHAVYDRLAIYVFSEEPSIDVVAERLRHTPAGRPQKVLHLVLAQLQLLYKELHVLSADLRDCHLGRPRTPLSYTKGEGGWKSTSVPPR